MITDLPGNLPTKSDRNLPHFLFTILRWNSFTCFERFSFTKLVWNFLTLVSWYINTLFYWNIFTDMKRDQLLLGLWNILADIIRVGHTCARNNNPDLLITLPFPSMITMLLLQSDTISLSIVLVLRTHLLLTNLFVRGVALLLQHLVADMLVCVNADVPVVYLALFLVLLCAHLSDYVIVGCLPYSLMQGPTDHFSVLVVLLNRDRGVVFRIARTLVVGGTIAKVEDEERENCSQYLHSSPT
jgi:hypothetical protein